MSSPTTASRSRAAVDPSTPVGNCFPSSTVLQSSLHYTTTRRHSLYGTEDRIVLDLGSRIWKAGFSGEGRPRDVFFVEHGERTTLWSLSHARRKADRDEEERMLRIKLQDRLRKVFHEVLLTDPKSRKVIIVEHPLLPMYIKDMMASILFENLQIPSLSFISSHMLALFGVGRMTGLVLDCGYLESTVLPIFASRPMYSQLQTSPLAGSRLTSHLRALLLMFATYIPPPTTLSGPASIPATSRAVRVPAKVLTDTVMEDIKARCCFVGEMLDPAFHPDLQQHRQRQQHTEEETSSESEVPPMSESSQAEHDPVDAPATPSSRLSSATPPSGMTAFTHSPSGAASGIGGSSSAAAADLDRTSGERHLQAIAAMYMRYSTATDLHLRVNPPPASMVSGTSQGTGTGQGTLCIPGWVRERAAEVLFEGGDVDEASVAELILNALLRVPVDLRRALAGAILVVGGTPMMPGFIPRLHCELVRLLTDDPPAQPPASPMNEQRQQQSWRHGQEQGRADNDRARRTDARPALPPYDPYAPLRPLAPYIAILNNPSPHPPPQNINSNAGKAPAFTPATLPWVGGSLAGAMKISGSETLREKWDEAEAGEPEDDGDDDTGLQSASLDAGASSQAPVLASPSRAKRPRFNLPDWTRAPLPHGAPPAPRPSYPPALSNLQTEVNA